MGHPFAEGEPVYDVTFENVQAGLRTDYLFRLANQRRGFVIGTGDLSELALGWCTYGVGDQMSHYDVNAGVPKTLIQYLIRWAARTDQFDRGDRRGARGDPRAPRSRPSWCRPTRAARSRAPRPRSAPTSCTTSSSTTSCATASAPSKVAFLAWHAWRDVDAGPLADRLPARRRGTPTTSPTIRKWLESLPRALLRASASSSARRMPNGPKVSAGGALSPRGDWRAPSDATAAAWLDELRRSLPPDALPR